MIGRFTDENGFCYASSAAQTWCNENSASKLCHGTAMESVTAAEWEPGTFPYRGSSSVLGTVSCACMKHCTCTTGYAHTPLSLSLTPQSYFLSLAHTHALLPHFLTHGTLIAGGKSLPASVLKKPRAQSGKERLCRPKSRRVRQRPTTARACVLHRHLQCQKRNAGFSQKCHLDRS